MKTGHLDFEKLNELSPVLQKKAIEYVLTDVDEQYLNFVNSNIIDYCLQKCKSKTKAIATPKLLNDWIKKGIIKISENDTGKIKRFSKLENIWINMVLDLRKFGISLDKITRIREQLDFEVQNYSYFKHNVLNAITGAKNYMLIFEDGDISFMNIDKYHKFTKKAQIPTHINLCFGNYVAKEFENNSFDEDFEFLKTTYQSSEKLKLLFFLKTNLFEEIRLELGDGDIRLISKSENIKENSDLKKAIEEWEFKKLNIVINDEVEAEITI